MVPISDEEPEKTVPLLEKFVNDQAEDKEQEEEEEDDEEEDDRVQYQQDEIEDEVRAAESDMQEAY